MNKEQILGISVCTTTYENLKQIVEKDIKLNKKSFIVAINPEKILKSRKDKDLANLLNGATYQIPDGIGIVYASKIKRGKIKSRITGIDSMEMLCELSNEKGYKIFLYGAKKEVVEKARDELRKKYSNIKIVGTMDGYEKDNTKICDAINKSKADIIFVALGSPKQELWIRDNMTKLCPKIYQGVGGSFDVFSGNIKRAPNWMQKSGLEWFYRLIKEPKRIFRQVKLLNFLLLIIFSKNKKGSAKNES